MAIRLIISFIISMVATIVTGLVLVPALRRMKAGQLIREDGPVWHKKKQGTPTMGGIMFIAGVLIACLTAGFNEMLKGVFSHIYVLLFALVFAAIGFIDDYAKLKKKQNLGLKAMHKFILQLIVAAGYLMLLWFTGKLTTGLYIPFFNVTVAIPEPVYFIIAAFAVVGTVNAVNITDGIDGLATGVTVPVAVCFAFIALLWNQIAIGIFAAALAGALCAFLFFNFHPAKAFMGDTGSLFLGGAVCATAFAMDMPLVLIPLGIVYFIETLSDIIQIGYFKISGGKRVFKMAPLHHHFEMCGWSEYLLFSVFTGVSVVFAALSYLGVRYRY